MATTTAGAAATSSGYPSPVLLTWVLAVVNFTQVLDNTICNVSIPAITGDLGTAPSQGAWIITSYSVAQAITVPLTGWVAGRFGQVRMMVFATMVFALMSLLSGFAWSLSSLVVFRIMQGAAGGFMVPLSQALMLGHNPPERRGIALSIWSSTTIVAPVMGPILGGWITDNIGWSWIFLVNVPISSFAALMVWKLLKNHDSPRTKLPLDTVGLVLMVAWIASLQIMLDIGNEEGWFESGHIVALATVAALGFALFLVWELTERHPIVDLTIFRNYNFVIAVVALGLSFVSNRGTVLVLPLWLQTQVGYTAQWAGFVMAPAGVVALMISPFVGRALRYIEPRVFSTIAFSVFTICYFWRSHFTGDADYWTYALPQALQGIAMAMFFVPLVTISMSGIEPHRLPAAAGMQAFVRSIMGSFGISAYITLWNRREAVHRTQLVEHVNAWSPQTTDYMGRLAGAGMQPDQIYSNMDRLVTQQAYAMATNDIYWVAMAISSVLIGFIWLARPPFGNAGRRR